MDHLRTHNSFVNKFLPRQSFYEIYYIIPINIKKELNNIFIGNRKRDRKNYSYWWPTGASALTQNSTINLSLSNAWTENEIQNTDSCRRNGLKMGRFRNESVDIRVALYGEILK